MLKENDKYDNIEEKFEDKHETIDDEEANDTIVIMYKKLKIK